MKLGDLRKIFEAAERIYREAGNATAAEALKEASSLCEGRESMTVAAFAKLIANQRSTN
jgi:hypothetical protein